VDPEETNAVEVMQEVSVDSEVEVEPRRIPTQERSRKRFDAMLDAFAELLVEMGFEAITTHHVAERAGVPVGTLYQFFPNKYALATALSRRYAGTFLQLVDMSLAVPVDEVDYVELFDRLLDAVSSILFADETVTTLWAITQIVPELRKAREESNAISLHTAQTFLRPYLPHLNEEQLHDIAMTFSRTTYALMYAACQEAQPERERTVREMKRLISAYLASYREG
jgi:AcrR family transcriptional regulator